MKDGARFSVIDLRTDRRVDVEAVQFRRQNRPEFGDSIYDKCDGSITEEESRIQPETHSNIRYVRNPLE